MKKFEIFRRVFPSLGPIILHHVFRLVNIVIFVVIVLLFNFGNGQAGFFIGVVFVLNTLIVIAQDINARVVLERLQMLTVLRIIRINKDNTETLILAEEIKKGDLLKIKIGDQLPCDGILISKENLEISEALITGESDSFPKKEGDKILAGSIVTSGFGIIKALNLFRESRLYVITGGVKKYATNPSSIQKATDMVIKYSGYIFFAVIIFVIGRGIYIHAPRVEIVMNIGALASTLIPQGLVVVTTLLFAVGAASYSKRNILFQEINATEKLGWIKNLCIDKTGTLTDNVLVVEGMNFFKSFKEIDAVSLSYACAVSSGDSSQSILSVKKYLDDKNKKEIEIIETLPFSSSRRFGAVKVKDGDNSQIIFVGTPDIFLPRISNEIEKKWLESVVEKNVQEGKRVLCFAHTDGKELPKGLEGLRLSVISVFVFRNTLRQGVEDAIKFFQNRGVHIRVLSGDNADTVRAVATSVGIKGANDVITGEQMEKWSESDYEVHAPGYSVFAQILPEQKVKLVEAFKKNGFTAMVGDGANDALAMKKSDLGIAMLDGVPVTRQVAGIILMNNSFTDLPGAVGLADHFIRSIEITSGIYINQSLVGLFFFIIISIFGYSYPLTPLNITFVNYFTVGLSGMLIAFWALRPTRKILPANDKPFLERIMPLVICCAIIEAIGIAIVLVLSPYYLKVASSNILVLFSFIILGFLFLLFAAKVYCGTLTKKEKSQLILLGIGEVILIYLIFKIPFLIKFFNITLPFPSSIFIYKTLLVLFLCGIAQYLLIQRFFIKKEI